MDSLLACICEAQELTNGHVSLNLYKGNIMVDGRTSPYNLYDEDVATMEGGGSYNQTDAEGDVNIEYDVDLYELDLFETPAAIFAALQGGCTTKPITAASPSQ